MDLNEFKNNLDKIGGPRSYMLFETFALKLLEEYFSKKSKPYFPHYAYKTDSERIFEFDAFAPEGIDELLGPTIIEIKYSASSDNIKNVLNNFHAILHRLLIINQNKHRAGSSINNIFLIFGDKLSGELKKGLVVYSDHNNVKLKLWDIQDLLHIMEDSSIGSINSLKELSELALNDTITKSLIRTSEERLGKKKDNINRLTEIYKNNGIVLFLGSGVSSDVGIPLWDTLISNLLVEMMREKLAEKSIVVDESVRDAILKKLLTKNDASPLLQARYIRTGLGKNFIKIMSKALYKNFRKVNDRWPESLEVLSQLCLPRRGGRGGVRAVITYNFDDVFERILTEKGIECVSIYRELDVPSQDELGIYHVHGFLPYDTDNEQLSQSLLVFSEEGYHSLLLNPYSWQNIIQLNFLRESTCVMVGLSLNDPNLRRLLAISALNCECPRHFVILPRTIFDDDNPDRVRGTIFDSFTNVNEELQEKSYQELGLNVIWAEDLEEIPGMLAFLKKNHKSSS